MTLRGTDGGNNERHGEEVGLEREPSMVGRRNCGCPPCQRDRTEYGCENPGQCVEAARALLECNQPKWNLLIASNDLCEHLMLSGAEKDRNIRGREDQDVQVTFDPDFRVTDISHGFRIFAFDDHITQFAAKCNNLPDPNYTTVDVYLHAKVNNPGQMSVEMQVMQLVQSKDNVMLRDTFLLSFPEQRMYASFNTTMLGGMLHIVCKLPKNIPLTVHTSSSFLGKVLVTNRVGMENNPLLPNYHLITCVISALQERSGRVHIKKVDINPAATLGILNLTPTAIDTQPDLMFCSPGILLERGSQHMFMDIIKSLRQTYT